MKYILILAAVFSISCSADSALEATGKNILSYLLAPSSPVDFGLLILTPTNSGTELPFLEMKFASSIEQNRIAVFNLSFARYESDLYPVFGVPSGLVGSERLSEIETFLDGLNGQRGMMVFRADESKVRYALLREIKKMIAKNRFERGGLAYSLDRISILIEVRPNDTVAPGLTAGKLIEDQQVKGASRAWLEPNIVDAHLYSKYQYVDALERHCNNVLSGLN